MRRRTLAATAAAAAVAVVSWLCWHAPGHASIVATALAPHAAAAPAAAAPVGSPARTFRTGLENLPSSLFGTEVPGELSADAAGNLILTRGVRTFFDYFLSASTEENAATLRARVAAAGRARLPRNAAAQLMDLYDSYVAYRVLAREAAAASPGDGLAQATARLQAIRRARSETLPPDAVRAFFADDDVYDDYQLSKAAILEDSTLGAADKAPKLSQLRDDLPASLRDGMSVWETVQNLNAVTDEWRQHGGSPEELRAIREQLVGEEATTRLEALDADNARWSDRVSDYLAARDQLLGDGALSAADRQAALDSLRSRSFSDEELVRAGAMERIHDASASQIVAAQ